jgi:hypothetical protein
VLEALLNPLPRPAPALIDVGIAVGGNGWWGGTKEKAEEEGPEVEERTGRLLGPMRLIDRQRKNGRFERWTLDECEAVWIGREVAEEEGSKGEKAWGGGGWKVGSEQPKGEDAGGKL